MFIFDNEDKIQKAKEAKSLMIDVNYTVQTNGFAKIKDAIAKEINAAREQAESDCFAEEVKVNPNIYFEHIGIIKGLKFIERYVSQVNIKGEKARKDLEKWEYTKNQATSKEK